jgi:hypothetical protein
LTKLLPLSQLKSDFLKALQASRLDSNQERRKNNLSSLIGIIKYAERYPNPNLVKELLSSEQYEVFYFAVQSGDIDAVNGLLKYADKSGVAAEMMSSGSYSAFVVASFNFGQNNWSLGVIDSLVTAAQRLGIDNAMFRSRGEFNLVDPSAEPVDYAVFRGMNPKEHSKIAQYFAARLNDNNPNRAEILKIFAEQGIVVAPDVVRNLRKFTGDTVQIFSPDLLCRVFNVSVVERDIKEEEDVKGGIKYCLQAATIEGAQAIAANIFAGRMLVWGINNYEQVRKISEEYFQTRQQVVASEFALQSPSDLTELVIGYVHNPDFRAITEGTLFSANEIARMSQKDRKEMMALKSPNSSVGKGSANTVTSSPQQQQS